MTRFRPKISIIGGGNVGIRYAYAILIKGVSRQLTIVDIDKKRIEGEIMDLSHGIPFTTPTQVKAGDYSDIKNSDLVVITAGRGQKPGETRLDLVKANVELFKKIIPQVQKYSPNSILLIVSNPVDILAYAAYKFSGKSPQKVIGSGTVLDSARFRYLIGQHCNIDPRNVHGYILGEHGDSEFVVWSKVLIGGMLIKDYCPLCGKKDICGHQKQFEQIFQEVRTSAYSIIQKKGETSYGIGLSLVRITEAILKDENAILPVSCLINNYLGIDDVYLSIPAILNKTGASKILKIELNTEEKRMFQHSARVLKDVLHKVGL